MMNLEQWIKKQVDDFFCQKVKIITLFFALILYFVLILEYLLIANTIAPILFEEQTVAKRKVIIGIKDKTVFFYSYKDIPEHEIQNGDGKENGFQKVIARAEKKFWFFSIIKKPLAPKITLKIFDLEIPILGWGFIGPGPHIIFKLYEKLRDFFGKFDLHLLGLRIAGLIFLFAFSLLFAKYTKSILALPFFLAFPVNLIYMHIESFYYLIMTSVTFLNYFMLQKKKFHIFHFLSAIQCFVHMRGYVITLAFILAFIVLKLVEKGERSREESFREIKQFIFSTVLFSPLYMLPLFIFSLPHLIKIQDEQKYEQYILALPNLSEIMRNYILGFISKIPLFPMLLLSKVRDFLITGNFQIFFASYGVLIKGTLTTLYSALMNIFFYLPALLINFKQNMLLFIFLGVYLILSMLAVPFFYTGPQQFLPLSFLILYHSYKKLEESKIKTTAKQGEIKGGEILIFCFCVIAVLGNMAMIISPQKYLQPSFLYSNHKKVMVKLEEIEKRIKNQEGKSKVSMLCITKGDIFYVKFDCDVGRPFISSEKIASKGMMKLAQISDLYDVIVVSEDYFDFYEYVKDKFSVEAKTDGFMILTKKSKNYMSIME